MLEVETRGPFKGPRAYDATGLPLAFDNQSIFKERIYLDKADPNILHDEITVIDHALTRPWTVDKRYVREPNPRPDWDEAYCTENRVDDRDRQGELFPERRRHADAGPQGSGAAGFAIFQADAEVIRGAYRTPVWAAGARDWRSCRRNRAPVDLSISVASSLSFRRARAGTRSKAGSPAPAAPHEPNDRRPPPYGLL